MSEKTRLFSPLVIANKHKSIEIRNRIILPPMDQYSAIEGKANEWHFNHYARCALGGAGLIIIESTAVCDKNAMISQNDLGLWEAAK